MPNVLKVFLENGQTKSFKYDSSTTVQVRYYLKKVTKHFVSFQATFETKHSKVKGYLLSFKEFSSLFPYFLAIMENAQRKGKPWPVMKLQRWERRLKFPKS